MQQLGASGQAGKRASGAKQSGALINAWQEQARRQRPGAARGRQVQACKDSQAKVDMEGKGSPIACNTYILRTSVVDVFY